jgi:hypothetical protein
MEVLISDSLKKSKEVHKSIKAFQEELSQPSKSKIIFRIKNFQLSLIKNEYLNVYREHATFVENYEEKLKKILKREAQISENRKLVIISLITIIKLILVARSISIEETEELIMNKETTPSLFTQSVNILK